MTWCSESECFRWVWQMPSATRNGSQGMQRLTAHPNNLWFAMVCCMWSIILQCMFSDHADALRALLHFMGFKQQAVFQADPHAALYCWNVELGSNYAAFEQTLYIIGCYGIEFWESSDIRHPMRSFCTFSGCDCSTDGKGSLRDWQSLYSIL